MSERIQNGNFSQEFDFWNNGVGGGLPYSLDGKRIKGESDDLSEDVKTYKIKSDVFSINNEVVSAVLNVWGKWGCPTGVENGAATFTVKLRKPDFSYVALAGEEKDGETGEGYILEDSDIKAHLSQYGNYELWLELTIKSALVSIEPDVYGQSSGWYDDISLNVAIKKYKTVVEHMGMEPATQRSTSKSVKEGIEFEESYSKRGYKLKVVAEAMEFVESTVRLVKKTVKEIIEFSERYFPQADFMKTVKETMEFDESYSAQKIRPHMEEEVMAFSEESFQAKKTSGNVVTTIYFDKLTEWTEKPRVTTEWIDERIVIL